MRVRLGRQSMTKQFFVALMARNLPVAVVPSVSDDPTRALVELGINQAINR